MLIPTTPVPSKLNRLSTLQILQYVVLICIVLYFGKTLFIPLSFALLISFILYPVCKYLEKKGINRSLAIAISVSVVTILAGGIIFLLFTQLLEFFHEWHSLKTKILESISQLSILLAEQFGLSAQKQSTLLENFIFKSGSQFVPLLQSTVNSFSELIFFLVLIPVFSILILLYRQMLASVLYSLFPTGQRKTIHEILIETIHEYYNFIKGMLLVYLIVGILNSVGLAIIGVPHPILFGFTASVLTFIPYVGILIASLLPITVSWITFNSIWYPVGVVLVFTIVQFLEANVIFPLAVSNRLKINTLVIIVVIVAGGILWGAAGMILFIPFLSIIKLMADRTESLKTISTLLSD